MEYRAKDVRTPPSTAKLHECVRSVSADTDSQRERLVNMVDYEQIHGCAFESGSLKKFILNAIVIIMLLYAELESVKKVRCLTLKRRSPSLWLMRKLGKLPLRRSRVNFEMELCSLGERTQALNFLSATVYI